MHEEEDHLNRLVDRFFFVGTKIVSSIAVIPDAIRVRENECGGEQVIFDYCYGLTKQVATTISSKGGTS